MTLSAVSLLKIRNPKMRNNSINSSITTSLKMDSKNLAHILKEILMQSHLRIAITMAILSMKPNLISISLI